MKYPRKKTTPAGPAHTSALQTKVEEWRAALLLRQCAGNVLRDRRRDLITLLKKQPQTADTRVILAIVTEIKP